MPDSRTIIYDNLTRNIISVLPNIYIRSRAHLHSLAPTHPLVSLAFFYEPAEFPISVSKDHIKQIAAGTPPTIFSPAGHCKSFAAFLGRRRRQIHAAKTIYCTFEGGMGDQILQAAAACLFARIWLDKALYVFVRPQYYAVMQRYVGINNLFLSSGTYDLPAPDLSVDMHTQYISDPRGALFGKASLYGASLGLARVPLSPSLSFSNYNPSATIALLGHDPRNNLTPKIGFHIRSASGSAKSWNTEPAQRLALLLSNHCNSHSYFIGSRSDWSLSSPNISFVDFNFSWDQTAWLISQLDLLICIDSGPMHLANALSIPSIILWGGTTFRDILGRDRLPSDIYLDLPCPIKLCYDCPNGLVSCMTKITPEVVLPYAISALRKIPRPPLPLYSCTRDAPA